MKYFGYNHAPVRQDRLQSLFEPKFLNFNGFIDLADDGLRIPSEGTLTFVPALRQVNVLWTNAYQLLRELAEDKEGYRHLPGSLNDPKSFQTYIRTYVYARMIIRELVAWQKLSQYDHAHIVAAVPARKISRNRVNSLCESLSAFPMFPAFASWGDFLVTPVAGNPEEVVYHTGYPMPVSLMTDIYGTAISDLQAKTYFPYHVFKRAAFDTLDDYALPTFEAKYQRMMTTVQNLIYVMTRQDVPGITGTAGPTLPSALKEDWKNIQSLFRMLRIPTNSFDWNSVPALTMDHALLDANLNRGMWIGADNIGANFDELLAYPTMSDMNGLIELRGDGDGPNLAMARGMMIPLALLSANLDQKAGDTAVLLGNVGYGAGSRTAVGVDLTDKDISGHRVISGFTQEDGWKAISTSFQADTTRQNAPLRFQQYGQRGQVKQNATIDMRVNDSVQWGAYMPVEDVGYHFLAWLSQALSLPYIGL